MTIRRKGRRRRLTCSLSITRSGGEMRGESTVTIMIIVVIQCLSLYVHMWSCDRFDAAAEIEIEIEINLSVSICPRSHSCWMCYSGTCCALLSVSLSLRVHYQPQPWPMQAARPSRSRPRAPRFQLLAWAHGNPSPMR